MQRIEYSLEIQGEVRDYEGRAVACGPDEFVLIVRDFTERALQARELERERDFSRTVVRSTPSFLALVDASGTAARSQPRSRAGRRHPRGGVDRRALLDALHRAGGHRSSAGGLRGSQHRRHREDRRIRARRSRRRASRRRLDGDRGPRRRRKPPLPPLRARRDCAQAGREGDPPVAGAHRLRERRGAEAPRAEPPRRRAAEPRQRLACGPPRGSGAPDRSRRGCSSISTARCSSSTPPTSSSASSRAGSIRRS